MMKKWFFALIVGLCCLVLPRSEAQLEIVAQSKTTFSIIMPQGTPTSVQSAAEEFQKVVEIATKVKLPLMKDVQEVSAPYISIGFTRQAQKAGVSAEKIPDEGFRFLTQNGNLYIIGPDTAEGEWTKRGGISNGTANGVYTFLEKYLGVRWLMPGDIGRDVPSKSTWTLEEIDHTEKPMFMFRRMGLIARNLEPEHAAKANEWGNRQRLGSSINLNYNHNWVQTVPPELFKEHPEWFAMIDGKRVPPVGQYKLETTNPELVKFYAEKAVASLRASGDRPTTFSLSPSDGRGWSESPESVALYDPAPSDSFDPEAPPGFPGTSSLVLKWYHDVAKIVEKEYPEGKLTGYIYADYLHPPTKFAMKLPNNFTPVIAPSFNYGYGLYRKETRERFGLVMDAWAKVAPEDWFYYDLPNQFLRQSEVVSAGNFSGNTAIISPAAPEILNIIFRGLVKANIKGAVWHADWAWSNSALANYLTAQLMWNPRLDANNLQNEWLQRAYGPQAGKAMIAFYGRLDEVVGAYYQKHSKAGYKLNTDMLKVIYAQHYAELESLLLEAKAQLMTPIQKQRFGLIENNFIVLQWRLRNAGFLDDKFASTYRKTDFEIAEIVEAEHPDLKPFPINPIRRSSHNVQFSRMKIKRVLPVKTLPAPAKKSTSILPNKDTIMLFSLKKGKVSIMPRAIDHAALFASYLIVGRKEGIVTSGIFVEGRPIEFEAEARQDYYLLIPPRAKTGYDLLINNAMIAQSAFDTEEGVLSLLEDNKSPLYVYGGERKLISATEGVIIAASPTLEVLQKKYRSTQLINLNQEWRFLPDAGVGLNAHKTVFDDSSWKTIDANDWWQNQGFPDYRDKAWYRKTFHFPQLEKKQEAILHFSGVDGTANVFLNGKRLGRHRVGSDFIGWDEPFSFDVTDAIKEGENTIAVQVASKSKDTAAGINQPVNILLGDLK